MYRVVKLEETKPGCIGGAKVIVATDDWGSQIIVKGTINGEDVHLLSRDFGSHEKAVEKAKELLYMRRFDSGYHKGEYGWQNLIQHGLHSFFLNQAMANERSR